jgi:hypothetical protein
MVDPKFRKQLSDKQVAILEFLFRYRFGSVRLLAVALDKPNESVIFRSLANLETQGYVAKHFEPDYRIKGKPAEYFLLPQALKLLKEKTYKKEITDAVIKNSYRNTRASETFRAGSLTLFAMANRLISLYPSLELFTAPELPSYDYLPKPLPDAYLTLEVGSKTKDYLLDYLEDGLPAYSTQFRIKQLITYWQNKAWNATKKPFPPILFICQSASLEKRLTKQVRWMLSRNDQVKISFYTTTEKAVLQYRYTSDAIWSNPTMPDVALTLEELS